MYKVIIVALLVFTHCNGRKNSTADFAELKETIQVFNVSFSKYDVEVLREMTADNYLHTNGSSRPIEKEEWLSYLQQRKGKMIAGDLAITKYELTDTLMRVSGASVLVLGRIDIEGIEDEVPFSTSLRVTNLWVFDDNAWRRAAFHDTKIELAD